MMINDEMMMVSRVVKMMKINKIIIGSAGL